MGKNSKYNFDILVQGNDLTSLLLVSYFESKNKKVAWITDDVLGGVSQGFFETPFGMVASDWSFYPTTERLSESIDKINSYLNLELPNEVNEVNFIYLNKGEVKPFFGFGSDKVNLMDAVTEIVQNKSQINLDLVFDEAIDQIKRSVGVEIFPQSSLTKIEFKSHQPDGHEENNKTDKKNLKDKIEFVEVNGKNNLYANQYFLGCNSKETQIHFSKFLTKKTAKEMNKSNLFSSIHVSFVHDDKINKDDVHSEIHVLYGKKADVALGKFSISPEGHLCSHWMNFLDNEEGLEDEVVASKIKEIKKQVKRMYPNVFDNLLYSKISLNKELWGKCSGDIEDPICLSAESNFFLTNGLLSRHLTRSDVIDNFCAIIEKFHSSSDNSSQENSSLESTSSK